MMVSESTSEKSNLQLTSKTDPVTKIGSLTSDPFAQFVRQPKVKPLNGLSIKSKSRELLSLSPTINGHKTKADTKHDHEKLSNSGTSTPTPTETGCDTVKNSPTSKDSDFFKNMDRDLAAMERRLESSWTRKTLRSQKESSNGKLKGYESIHQLERKKWNASLNSGDIKKELKTNKNVGSGSQKLSQSHSKSQSDLLGKLQRSHSFGVWSSIREPSVTDIRKPTIIITREIDEADKPIKRLVELSKPNHAKSSSHLDRKYSERLDKSKNPIKEMEMLRKPPENDTILSRPLRERHQSLPDFVQNFAANSNQEKLSPRHKGKSELSSNLSVSKRPVEDLIQALREDVEKLNRHREKQKEHESDLTCVSKWGKKKPGAVITRSRSFGTIEHEYLNSKGETPPRLLPRSSSKEAIHRLAKLHRAGSTQSEKRLLDFSFQSENDVFRNSSDNGSEENHKINKSFIKRPPLPKGYNPTSSYRSRNLSEPSLNQGLGILSASLKDALNEFEGNVSPKTKTATLGSRHQDSDLEVEYRSSPHSSLSGISSTSLLTSPNSNFSAHSSSHRSSNHQVNSNNFHSSRGERDLLESRIHSFYDGSPQSMDWLTNKFDFLQTNIPNALRRQKDPAYKSGKTGTKLKSNSDGFEPSRSLLHSNNKYAASDINSKSSGFAGQRQTSETNWKFQKMEPKIMPRKPEAKRNNGANFKSFEQTKNPSQNHNGSFVFEFEPSQVFMEGLQETDILGSSMENVRSVAGDDKSVKSGNMRTNYLADQLRGDDIKQPFLSLADDVIFDPESHSQYVETLKNLAPIWLTNPGAHPKSAETARLQRQRRDRLASATKMCTFKTFATEVETARLCRPKRRRCDQDYIDGYDAQYYGYLWSEKTKGTRQRSLSTSAAVNNILDKEELWRETIFNNQSGSFILPLQSPVLSRPSTSQQQQQSRTTSNSPVVDRKEQRLNSRPSGGLRNTLKDLSPLSQPNDQFHSTRNYYTSSFEPSRTSQLSSGILTPAETLLPSSKLERTSSLKLNLNRSLSLKPTASSTPPPIAPKPKSPTSLHWNKKVPPDDDVMMKLANRNKSKPSREVTEDAHQQLDMGNALAELDAAVNSLQDLALEKSEMKQKHTTRSGLGPPPSMKSFGKSQEPAFPTTTRTGLSSFVPSARISTNYPQFPSHWGDGRRAFSPERDPGTPDSSRTGSSYAKNGSLANAFNEFASSKRSQIPRQNEVTNNGSIPARSRSFLRSTRPENFGNMPFKRSGSEEPTVISPLSNPARFDNLPFPNQFTFPADANDSAWPGSPSKMGGNLNELSIITSNDVMHHFGHHPDNQSLASMDSSFRFRSTASVKSDADYINDTLPHKNSSMRTVNINYHNVGGNSGDAKSPPTHFIPTSPVHTENLYCVPSSPETSYNLAATCEKTSKLWYRPKMSRDDIMAALCRQPVGSFIIRDSTSYPGYYGLAIKTDMSGVNGTAISSSSDSIRHFLIETSVRGARIKGSPAEPHYKSLADLVEQHARTAISLPCKLVLPHIPSQSQSQNNHNTNNKQQQYNQSQQSMESLNFNSSTIGRSGSNNNNNNRQHMGGFSMGPKSPNHVAVTIPTVQLPFDDDMKDGSIISSVSRRMKSPNRGDSMALHQLSANFKPDRANSNTSLNSQHTTSSVNTSLTNTNASFNGSAQISAACMVLYLGCYDVESLSGASAVNRAMFCLAEDERQLERDMREQSEHQPQPNSPYTPTTVQQQQQQLNSRQVVMTSEPSPVHFRMDQKSVTVTDMSRKVFFRKCISLQALLYCGIPASSNWGSVKVNNEQGKGQVKKVFGLVTRKDGQMSAKTNQCWLFAEYEEDQPASAIINFARKLTSALSPASPFPTNPLNPNE